MLNYLKGSVSTLLPEAKLYFQSKHHCKYLGPEAQRMALPSLSFHSANRLVPPNTVLFPISFQLKITIHHTGFPLY